MTLIVENSQSLPEVSSKVKKTYDIYQDSSNYGQYDDCLSETDNVGAIEFENIVWNRATALEKVTINGIDLNDFENKEGFNNLDAVYNCTKPTSADEASVLTIKKEALKVLVSQSELNKIVSGKQALEAGASYDVVLSFEIPETDKLYVIDSRITLNITDTTPPEFGTKDSATGKYTISNTTDPSTAYNLYNGTTQSFSGKQNTAASATVERIKYVNGTTTDETKHTLNYATDVILQDNQLIFAKSYMQELSVGTYTYEVTFTDKRKTKLEVTIKVTDTTAGTVSTEQERTIDIYKPEMTWFIVEKNTSEKVELHISKGQGQEDIVLTEGTNGGNGARDVLRVIKSEGSDKVEIPEEAFKLGGALAGLTYGIHNVTAVFKTGDNTDNTDNTVEGKLTLRITTSQPDPSIEDIQTQEFDIHDPKDISYGSIKWESSNEISAIYIDKTDDRHKLNYSDSDSNSEFGFSTENGNVTLKRAGLERLKNASVLKAGNSYPVKVVFKTVKAGVEGSCTIDSRLTLKVKDTTPPTVTTNLNQSFDKNSKDSVVYEAQLNSATSATVAGASFKENENGNSTSLTTLPEIGGDIKVEQNAITFRNSYLKTLNEGIYTFTLQFNDEALTSATFVITVTDTTPGEVLTDQEKTEDKNDISEINYSIQKNKSTAVALTIKNAKIGGGAEADYTVISSNSSEVTNLFQQAQFDLNETAANVQSITLTDSHVTIPEEAFTSGGVLENLNVGTYNVTLTFVTAGNAGTPIEGMLKLIVVDSTPGPEVSSKSTKVYDIYQPNTDTEREEAKTNYNIENDCVIEDRKGITFENIVWNSAVSLTQVEVGNNKLTYVENGTKDYTYDKTGKTLTITKTALDNLASSKSILPGEVYDIVLTFSVPNGTSGEVKDYKIDSRLTLKVTDTTPPTMTDENFETKYNNSPYDKKSKENIAYAVTMNTATRAKVTLERSVPEGGTENSEGKVLSYGTDVTLADGKLTFAKSYLQDELEAGKTYYYTVEYNDARKTTNSVQIKVTDTTPGTVETEQEKTIDMYEENVEDISFVVRMNTSTDVKLTIKNVSGNTSDIPLTIGNGAVANSATNILSKESLTGNGNIVRLTIPKEAFKTGGALANLTAGKHAVVATFTTKGSDTSEESMLSLKAISTQPDPVILRPQTANYDVAKSDDITFDSIKWNSGTGINTVYISTPESEIPLTVDKMAELKATGFTNITSIYTVTTASANDENGTLTITKEALDALAQNDVIKAGKSYDVKIKFDTKKAGVENTYTIDSRLTLNVITTKVPDLTDSKWINDTNAESALNIFDKNVQEDIVYTVNLNSATSADVTEIKKLDSAGNVVQSATSIPDTGSEMKVEAGKITFKKGYLASLDADYTYAFKVTFNNQPNNKVGTAKIKIVDTTPGEVLAVQEKTEDLNSKSDISYEIRKNRSEKVELTIVGAGTDPANVVLHSDSTSESNKIQLTESAVKIPAGVFTTGALQNIKIGSYPVTITFITENKDGEGTTTKDITDKLTLVVKDSTSLPEVKVKSTQNFDVYRTTVENDDKDQCVTVNGEKGIKFENIYWNIAANRGSLKSVHVGTATLTTDDYVETTESTNGETITSGNIFIKASALANLTKSSEEGVKPVLEVGNTYDVTLVFAIPGNTEDQKEDYEIDSRLAIRIINTTPPEMTDNPSITYNKANGTTAEFSVTANTATAADVEEVKENDEKTALEYATDVKLQNNRLVFAKSYLQSLAVGEHTFNVTFNDERKTQKQLKITVKDTTAGTVSTEQEKTIDLFNTEDISYTVEMNASTDVKLQIVKDINIVKTLLVTGTTAGSGEAAILEQSDVSGSTNKKKLTIPKSAFDAGGALADLQAGRYGVKAVFTTPTVDGNGSSGTSVDNMLKLKVISTEPNPEITMVQNLKFDVYEDTKTESPKNVEFGYINWNTATGIEEVYIGDEKLTLEQFNGYGINGFSETNSIYTHSIPANDKTDKKAGTLTIMAEALKALVNKKKLKAGTTYPVKVVFNTSKANIPDTYTIDSRLTLAIEDTTPAVVANDWELSAKEFNLYTGASSHADITYGVTMNSATTANVTKAYEAKTVEAESDLANYNGWDEVSNLPVTGSDLRVANGTVIFKTSYLSTLKAGMTYKFTVQFADKAQTERNVYIKVTDTTPGVVSTDQTVTFDKYLPSDLTIYAAKNTSDYVELSVTSNDSEEKISINSGNGLTLNESKMVISQTVFGSTGAWKDLPTGTYPVTVTFKRSSGTTGNADAVDSTDSEKITLVVEDSTPEIKETQEKIFDINTPVDVKYDIALNKAVSGTVELTPTIRFTGDNLNEGENITNGSPVQISNDYVTFSSNRIVIDSQAMQEMYDAKQLEKNVRYKVTVTFKNARGNLTKVADKLTLLFKDSTKLRDPYIYEQTKRVDENQTYEDGITFDTVYLNDADKISKVRIYSGSSESTEGVISTKERFGNLVDADGYLVSGTAFTYENSQGGMYLKLSSAFIDKFRTLAKENAAGKISYGNYYVSVTFERSAKHLGEGDKIWTLEKQLSLYLYRSPSYKNEFSYDSINGLSTGQDLVFSDFDFGEPAVTIKEVYERTSTSEPMLIPATGGDYYGYDAKNGQFIIKWEWIELHHMNDSNIYYLSVVFNDGTIMGNVTAYQAVPSTSTPQNAGLNTTTSSSNSNDVTVPVGSGSASGSRIMAATQEPTASTQTSASKNGIIGVVNASINGEIVTTGVTYNEATEEIVISKETVASLPDGINSIVVTMEEKAGKVNASAIVEEAEPEARVLTRDTTLTQYGITVTKTDDCSPGLQWKVDENGEAYITGYDGESKKLVLPASLGEYKVTAIQSLSNSEGDDTYESVFIPATVTAIETNAISKASAIKTEEGSAAESYAAENNLTTVIGTKDSTSIPTVEKQTLTYDLTYPADIVIKGVDEDTTKLQSVAIKDISFRNVRSGLDQAGNLTFSKERLAKASLNANEDVDVQLEFEDGTIVKNAVTLQVKASQKADDTDKDNTNKDNTGDKKETEQQDTKQNDQKSTTAKKVSIKKASVSMKASVTYKGKAAAPKVKVVLSGKKLKKGTDYTVTYKNNKAIGTATAVIKGTGSYKGKIKAKFEIVPKKTKAVKATKAEVTTVSLSWSSVKGAKKYEVLYSTKKNMQGAAKITTKKASAVLKKLTAGRKYYVKVRAIKAVKGKIYAGAYSKTASVKTTQLKALRKAAQKKAKQKKTA